MNIEHIDMRNAEGFDEAAEHYWEFAKQRLAHSNKTKVQSKNQDNGTLRVNLLGSKNLENKNVLVEEFITDQQVRQLQSSYNNLRDIVIGIYNQNTSKAFSLKKLMAEMIQTEKDHHIFNPDNWEGFKTDDR